MRLLRHRMMKQRVPILCAVILFAASAAIIVAYNYPQDPIIATGMLWRGTPASANHYAPAVCDDVMFYGGWDSPDNDRIYRMVLTPGLNEHWERDPSDAVLGAGISPPLPTEPKHVNDPAIAKVCDISGAGGGKPHLVMFYTFVASTPNTGNFRDNEIWSSVSYDNGVTWDDHKKLHFATSTPGALTPITPGTPTPTASPTQPDHNDSGPAEPAVITGCPSGEGCNNPGSIEIMWRDTITDTAFVPDVVYHGKVSADREWVTGITTSFQGLQNGDVANPEIIRMGLAWHLFFNSYRPNGESDLYRIPSTGQPIFESTKRAKVIVHSGTPIPNSTPPSQCGAKAPFAVPINWYGTTPVDYKVYFGKMEYSSNGRCEINNSPEMHRWIMRMWATP